jgi:hypothetical protein
MMKNRKYKKAGVSTAFVSGLIIVLLLVVFTAPKPIVIEEEGKWKVIWKGNLAEASEHNPGAGASGFLEFFWTNHTATPNTAYDENSSATIESWCTANMPGKTPYATADSFSVEVEHSVTFDYVCRARFNKTHCWDGSQFIGARCRINLTVSGDNTISDATGTLVESYNNSGANYLWVNVYWNNGGAGYTNTAGGGDTISEISIEAQY